MHPLIMILKIKSWLIKTFSTPKYDIVVYKGIEVKLHHTPGALGYMFNSVFCKIIRYE